MNFEKLVPQAIDIEEYILGSIIAYDDCQLLAIPLLREEFFYKDINKTIYKYIIELDNLNKSIDLVTIIQQLKDKHQYEYIGGYEYISKIVQRCGSGAGLDTKILILKEKYLRREIINYSQKNLELAYDENIDIFDILNENENKLINLTKDIGIKQPAHISSNMNTWWENTMNKINNKGNILGVPSGLISIDKELNGFQDTNLIIVGGRPGMGKTAFTLNLTINQSIYFNKSIGIISLEMSVNELIGRMMCDLSEIDNNYIKNGNLKEDEIKLLENAYSKLTNSKIFIDDSAGISLADIRIKSKLMKLKYNIEILYIDYLQLIINNGRNGTRENDVSEISRGLKQLAKELNIPIIVLSQLSRKVEERPNKIPILSDLRESGSIEQDADIVIFLYRPSYYKISVDQDGKDYEKNDAEFIIAKYRNGRTGKIKVTFIEELMKFTDLESDLNAFDRISNKEEYPF